MTTELTYMSRVAEGVAEKLRGADIIAALLSEINEYERESGLYWERVYVVAWERADQCGTHNVHINSEGDVACFTGHYDMTRDDAIDDMLRRYGIVAKMIKRRMAV